MSFLRRNQEMSDDQQGQEDNDHGRLILDIQDQDLPLANGSSRFETTGNSG